MCNMNGINLNFSSVSDICNADQVMVYAWKDCLYVEVAMTLAKKDSPIKKVLDSGVGLRFASMDKRTTLEGRLIKQICACESEGPIGRICKAGITSLMLENYKRKQ